MFGVAFVVCVLGMPLVSELSGRVSEGTLDFLRGILIGGAIVFLAAIGRTFTKSASRSQV